jgi:hypothetical protein
VLERLIWVDGFKVSLIRAIIWSEISRFLGEKTWFFGKNRLFLKKNRDFVW